MFQTFLVNPQAKITKQNLKLDVPHTTTPRPKTKKEKSSDEVINSLFSWKYNTIDSKGSDKGRCWTPSEIWQLLHGLWAEPMQLTRIIMILAVRLLLRNQRLYCLNLGLRSYFTQTWRYSIKCFTPSTLSNTRRAVNMLSRGV